jgi:hypothetical protein
MKLRKFCSCGVKLEREAADEDSARRIVATFRLEHSGAGHGPTDAKGYAMAISRIIRANINRRDQRLGSSGQGTLRVFRVIQGGKR